MKRYGLYGENSRDFLTYGGKVLWHNNAAEMEFLFNGTVRVREIPDSMSDELMLHIGQHPKLSHVRFPLQRGDFVRRAQRPTTLITNRV